MKYSVHFGDEFLESFLINLISFYLILRKTIQKPKKQTSKL